MKSLALVLATLTFLTPSLSYAAEERGLFGSIGCFFSSIFSDGCDTTEVVSAVSTQTNTQTEQPVTNTYIPEYNPPAQQDPEPQEERTIIKYITETLTPPPSVSVLGSGASYVYVDEQINLLKQELLERINNTTTRSSGGDGISRDTLRKSIDSALDGTATDTDIDNLREEIMETIAALPTSTGGESFWTESGSDIYFDEGQVGIGTSTITHALAIQPQPFISSLILYDSSGTGSMSFSVNPTGYSSISVDGGTGIDVAGILMGESPQNDGFIGVLDGISTDLLIGKSDDTGNYNIAGGNVVVTGGGNVGIGTTEPTAKLHIQGASENNYMRLMAPYNDYSDGLELSIDDNGQGDGFGSGYMSFNAEEGFSVSTQSYDNSLNSSFSLYSGGVAIDLFNSIAEEYAQFVADSSKFTFNGANVGIGTQAPLAKLHVAGANGGYARILSDVGYDDIRFYTEDTNNEYSGSFELFMNPEEGFGVLNTNSATGLSLAYDQVIIDTTSTIFGRGNSGQVIISDGWFGSEIGLMGDNDDAIAVRLIDGSYQYGGGVPGDGRLVVDADGNVGIGAPSPEGLFEVSAIGEHFLLIDPADQIYAIGDTRYTANGTGLVINDLSEVSYFERGNVGINTTSPAALLEVQGNHGGYVQFFDDANSDFLDIIRFDIPAANEFVYGSRFIMSPEEGLFLNSSAVVEGINYASTIGAAADNITLYSNAQSGSNTSLSINSSAIQARTNNIARLSINVAGNIGIGTESPEKALEIKGGTNGASSVLLRLRNPNSNDGTGAAIDFMNTTGTGFDDYAGAKIATVRQPGSSNDLLFHANSNSGSLPEIMRLRGSDGFVGIGTASPTAKLHVAGVHGDSYARIMRDAGTYDSFEIRTEDTGGDDFGIAQFSVSPEDGVGFSTQNSDGTASAYLGVLNNGNGVVLRSGNISNPVYVTGDNSLGISVYEPTQKLDVDGNARFRAVTSGTYAFDLNLTSDGTLTTSASDRRLKDNIESLNASSTLEKILKLQPSSFTWKADGTADIGLIAQDVATVFPELTFTNPTDGYMGVNYSRLSTLLISAVQELYRKVEGFSTLFVTEKVETNEVETKKLCIDGLCITRDELETILIDKASGSDAVESADIVSENTGGTEEAADGMQDDTEENGDVVDAVADEETSEEVAPETPSEPEPAAEPSAPTE